MNRRFTKQCLRALRNDVDIKRVIEQMLDWPCKTSEGHFRFLCPRCKEFNSATNPKTNLGRCFCCHTNFNPIDFVIAVEQCSFVQAVEFLKQQQQESEGSDATHQSNRNRQTQSQRIWEK